MPLTDEQLKAALVLKDMDPHERAALIHKVSNADRFTKEHSKPHVLTTFTLSDAEVADFCSHLTDGGGVVDPFSPILGDRNLFDLFMTAIHDHDGPTLCHLLPHVVKSWLLEKAVVRSHRGGGRTLRGSPSTVTAAIQEQYSTPKIAQK